MTLVLLGFFCSWSLGCMSIILSTWFFWCWIIYMLLRFCFLASISQTFNLVFWCLPHIFSQTLASFSCMIASTNFKWLESLHIVVPSVTRLPVVERPLTMITVQKTGSCTSPFSFLMFQPYILSMQTWSYALWCLSHYASSCLCTTCPSLPSFAVACFFFLVWLLCVQACVRLVCWTFPDMA